MRRSTSIVLIVLLVAATGGRGRAQAVVDSDPAGIRTQQAGLDAELRELETRLGSGGLAAGQAVADSERLRARYRALRPLAPSFGGADVRHQGPLAQRSFAWLHRLRTRFPHDRAVTRSLLGTYATLGDFYGRSGLGSRLGFWLGYAGAHREGRSLLLDGGGERDLERRLEQLALEWAAIAAVGWSPDPWPWAAWNALPPGYDHRIAEAVGAARAAGPVALPRVDESLLQPADLARWQAVRERFVGVAARAHEAQLALADLGQRLAGRGLGLHPRTVSASLAMQGYLEDAVAAAEARDFDRAREALARAEYERGRLRSATGR